MTKKPTKTKIGKEERSYEKVHDPDKEPTIRYPISVPLDWPDKARKLASQHRDELKAAGESVSVAGLVRFAVDKVEKTAKWPKQPVIETYERYGIKGVIPDFVTHDFRALLYEATNVVVFTPALFEFLSVDGNRIALSERFLQGKATQLHIPAAPAPDDRVEIRRADFDALVTFIRLIGKSRFAAYVEKYKVLDRRQRQRGFHFCFSPPQVGFLEVRMVLTESVCIVSHSPTIEPTKIAIEFARTATPHTAHESKIFSVNGKPTIGQTPSAKNDFYEHYFFSFGAHAYRFKDSIIEVFDEAIREGRL